MSTAKNILNSLTSAISKTLGSKADVDIEFTGRRMELPIKTVQVATGIRNASVSYTYDSEGNKNTVRNLTIEALICAPKTEKGVTLADIVDGILTASLSDGSPTLQKFYTSRANYSTTLGAIIQSVFITVEF
jgi:hypothetical protein